MRRAGAPHREILPDPKYGSRLVAKFVNIMMICGKKSTAERIMYDAMASVEDRSKQEALKMFKTAIDNVKPAVEVKSRRVGGSTYQVPVEVRPDRRTSLAMRWMITAARRRSERSMADELAGRDAGCRQQSRHGGEEARGHAQDGGGQQGVRALPLVAELSREGGSRARSPLFVSREQRKRGRTWSGSTP